MNDNNQRAGQRAFNALYDSHPEIADKIRGSLADPFHRDERLPLFYKWVAELFAEADNK